MPRVDVLVSDMMRVLYKGGGGGGGGGESKMVFLYNSLPILGK